MLLYEIHFVFFLNAPATTKIYTSLHSLSLHYALPISSPLGCFRANGARIDAHRRRLVAMAWRLTRFPSRAARNFDLFRAGLRRPVARLRAFPHSEVRQGGNSAMTGIEIGRAAWRERVCKYV